MINLLSMGQLASQSRIALAIADHKTRKYNVLHIVALAWQDSNFLSLCWEEWNEFWSWLIHKAIICKIYTINLFISLSNYTYLKSYKNTLTAINIKCVVRIIYSIRMKDMTTEWMRGKFYVKINCRFGSWHMKTRNRTSYCMYI